MAKKRGKTQEPEEAEAKAPEAEPAEEREVKVVDKRRFARLLGFGPDPQPGAPQPGAPQPGGDVMTPDAAAEPRHLPSFVEELQQRAERAEQLAERAEAHTRAEIEATRARLERHYESRLASARAEIVAGILEVLDNLERALQAPGAAESPLLEGVTATRDIFLRKLAELGLESVPTVGEPFDPEVHEAIDEVPVEDPGLDGCVVESYQTGFRLGDRLVRPARVRVGRLHAASDGESRG